MASAKAAHDRRSSCRRATRTPTNYALLAARQKPADARALLCARSAGIADPTIEAELGVLGWPTRTAPRRSAFERSWR